MKILLFPVTLVVGLVFLAYFLLLFPLYFILIKIGRPWSHNLVHNLNWIWGCVTSVVLLSPTITRGRKNLRKGQVYIFAANHCSYWDIPACTIALPCQFRFMGKVELAKVPLFGLMFREVYIPVNRGNRIEAARSLESAREKLNRGISVLIFPEGTIPDKKTVTLGPFKDGAFRLAAETGIPVVPMTLVNTDRVMPDARIPQVFPLVPVKVWLDEPIETANLGPDGVGALKERVRDAILSRLTPKQKENEK